MLPSGQNGRHRHINLPHSMLNVISGVLSRSNGTCQYHYITYMNETTVVFAKSGRISSMVIESHWFLCLALIKSLGFRYILKTTSGFSAGIMKLIHSMCPLTSAMKLDLSSLQKGVECAGLL